MNVDNSVCKKVRFDTNMFYSILDNLYISDQISSFNEELLKSNKITCLINLTKSTQFLHNDTKNIHHQIFNGSSSIDEKIKEINNIVHKLFTLLSQGENVLLYCENGSSKSFIILSCFLMMHCCSEQIITIENVLRFIKWKTKQSFSEESTPNFSLIKQYRIYLQSKKSFDSIRKKTKQHKVVSIIRNHFSMK